MCVFKSINMLNVCMQINSGFAISSFLIYLLEAEIRMVAWISRGFWEALSHAYLDYVARERSFYYSKGV